MSTASFDVPYPLVVVEWADHYSNYEDGFSQDDITKMLNKLCIRKTVGYLVGENKRQIAIAGTAEEDGTFSEVFICMKKAIISITERRS